MKSPAVLFVAFLGLLVPCLGQGDLRLPLAEVRDWTNHSGKVISGKIVDKAEDNSRVKLLLDSGKEAWVNTDDVIGEDLRAVMAWEKLPEGFEFVKVENNYAGPLLGYMRTNVTLRASAVPLHAVVKWGVKQIEVREEVIPAGETMKFVSAMSAKGWITLSTEDGTVVAEWRPGQSITGK